MSNRRSCAFGWSIVCLLFAATTATTAAAADPPKVGQRWALLIGVDDYAYAQKLQYCGADQTALAKQLIASGFPAENVFLVHDKSPDQKLRPSHANIERQLKLVLNLAEAGDLVLIGFSGHGVHLDKKSYLCPVDCTLDDDKTLISVDAIYDQLKECAADFKLVVVDACRNDPRPGGTRAMTPTDGTRALARSLQELKVPEGVVLLNSCAPGEVSWEDEKFGHGVFMHFVLDGLKGAADTGGDGSVSLTELQAYAGAQTKAYVARKFAVAQRPFFKGDLTTEALEYALLPVPGGGRKAVPDARFPPRPEIGPDTVWLGDSRWNLYWRWNLVLGMLDDGPAAQAGLKPGDVIQKIGGEKVPMAHGLQAALKTRRPGETVDFEIEREGNTLIVPVTLEAMPTDGGLSRLTAAADAGETWAMVELGQRYGRAILGPAYADENQAESVRWFRRAADAGSITGLMGLADRYAVGKGVPQNYHEAVRLLEQARALALRQNDRRLATECEVLLAVIYFDGKGGVPKDQVTALQYLRDAADRGQLRAINFLATLYENGELVSKDLNKALALYQAAAEQGFPDAQYNIGLMIYNGVFSTRDLTQARGWVELAAENNNLNAMYMLAVMLEKGEGGPRNLAKAAEWYRKAADRGHVEAMRKLQ